MSVIPAKVDFPLYKGATFRRDIIFHRGDINSPVLDLSGYTVNVPVRDHPGGATIDSIPATIDGLNGKVTLLLTDEATAAITWPRGFYTIYITEPDGDTDAYLHGALKLRTT